MENRDILWKIGTFYAFFWSNFASKRAIRYISSFHLILYCLQAQGRLDDRLFVQRFFWFRHKVTFDRHRYEYVSYYKKLSFMGREIYLLCELCKSFSASKLEKFGFGFTKGFKFWTKSFSSPWERNLALTSHQLPYTITVWPYMANC